MLFMKIQTVYSWKKNPMNKLCGVYWDIYLKRKLEVESVQLIQPMYFFVCHAASFWKFYHHIMHSEFLTLP